MSIQSENLTNFEDGLKAAKKMVTADFEKHALHHYLNKSRGSVTKAANYAKLPRSSFYRLLDKHDVDPDHFKKE